MKEPNGKPNAADIVARLARKEQEATSRLILAPVLPRTKIKTQVDGIVWELAVEDRNFRGWALLRITSPGKATVEDTPRASEIAAYLKLLMRVRLVLLEQQDNIWWALPAQERDPRLQIPLAVPVEMVEKQAAFDTINARFDGSRFWYEGGDRRRDPTLARKLRQALAADESPGDVHVLGAVPQELRVYRLLWRIKHPEETKTTFQAGPATDEERLREALSHADAELDAFWLDPQGNFVVRFLLDGLPQTTVVTRDLNVLTAGICLSGQDRNFDLTSLVGVYRESRQDDYYD